MDRNEDAPFMRGFSSPLTLLRALTGGFGYWRMQSWPRFQALRPPLGNTVLLMGIVFVLTTVIAVAGGVTAAVSRAPVRRQLRATPSNVCDGRTVAATSAARPRAAAPGVA